MIRPMIRPMIRIVLFAAALVMLLIGSLSACAPISPEAIDAHDDHPHDEPMEQLGNSFINSCDAVPDQAVVYGSGDIIDEALADANESRLGVKEIGRFIRAQSTASHSQEEPTLTVVLLEGPNLPVLAEQWQERYPDLIITPNYVARAIESEGHSPSQSPFGSQPTVIEGTSLSPDVFFNQWAIDEIAMTMLYQEKSGGQGENVTIAIFDSTPYTVVVPSLMISEEILPGDVASTLNMDVRYATIQGPARDHGLFVASLAHAIAPSAKITLYRTLNENGDGSVYTLAEQLSRFHREYILEPYQADADQILRRAVANMSLSLACQHELTTSLADKEMKFLLDTFDALHQDGIVMVAAAGNDGKVGTGVSLTTTRPYSSFPANHELVIGVGATEMSSRTPACYSNQADIFAPGGSGSDNECLPIHHQCLVPASGDFRTCGSGLIGLATASDTRLAFWAGTSFATPLMSGLVALILSDPAVAIKEHDITTLPVIDTFAVHDMLYQRDPANPSPQYSELTPDPDTIQDSAPYDYYLLR